MTVWVAAKERKWVYASLDAKPSLIILDELDSGLDVDALKVCANSIMEYYHEKWKNKYFNNYPP